MVWFSNFKLCKRIAPHICESKNEALEAPLVVYSWSKIIKRTDLSTGSALGATCSNLYVECQIKHRDDRDSSISIVLNEWMQWKSFHDKIVLIQNLEERIIRRDSKNLSHKVAFFSSQTTMQGKAIIICLLTSNQDISPIVALSAARSHESKVLDGNCTIWTNNRRFTRLIVRWFIVLLDGHVHLFYVFPTFLVRAHSRLHLYKQSSAECHTSAISHRCFLLTTNANDMHCIQTNCEQIHSNSHYRIVGV